MNKPFALTDEQRRVICERYIAGESSNKLAKDYGVTKHNVLMLLETRHIPRRANTPELRRTYKCNHAYFDEPVNEHKIYWIGLLLADGCITAKNTIMLSLQKTDIKHIEKFRSDLNSNHPIKVFTQVGNGFGHGKVGARISINSVTLTDSLIRYGVVPRKTGNQQTPDLPADMMRHFYRGYFDGNGSISLYSLRSWLNSEVELIGPRQFLEDFSLWIAKETGANHNTPRQCPNSEVAFRLKFGGLRQSSTILQYLYTNSTIYLDRKYDIAMQVIKAADNQNSHRRDDGLTLARQ